MRAYTQISGIILTSRKRPPPPQQVGAGAGAGEAPGASGESMMDGSMKGGDGKRGLGSGGEVCEDKSKERRMRKAGRRPRELWGGDISQMLSPSSPGNKQRPISSCVINCLQVLCLICPRASRNPDVHQDAALAGRYCRICYRFNTKSTQGQHRQYQYDTDTI